MKHFAIVLLFATLGHGCSGSACDRIADACHDKDTGSGPIHDCHELAENSTEAECEANEDSCLATCGE